jgi:hypothetical protein
MTTAGAPTVELDVGTRGVVQGTGIESQDIASMTDRMVRDLLTMPQFAAARVPPQIIVESSNFENQSSQAINKEIIVDQLRIQLLRAAQGRMVFVSRTASAAAQRERDLKRQGITDTGTTGLTRAVAGADYMLFGKIQSLTERDARGMIQRTNYINFEMIDLERSVQVWGNTYSFKRAGADDVVYR